MAYFKRGQLIERPYQVVTSGGTTTLTATTSKVIRCTGSQNHTVQLPAATGLDLNHGYIVRNLSTASISVVNNGGTLIAKVPKNLDYGFYVSDSSTANGVWDVAVSGYAEDTPLKLRAAFVPDTKVYIEANSKLAFDGTGLSSPPVKSLIATVPLSSYDFTSGASSGATFLGTTIPSGSVGQYVRAGFTLLSSGSIQILWSSYGASLAALSNPGSLFIKSGLPIGYVDLVRTVSGLKTAGSSSNVIENSVNDVPCIWRFGSGSGGGSGSGDASTALESLKNQFEKSYFQLLTPGIFSTDQSTKVDTSSTGAYSLVDDTFNFTAVGQTLVTKNLLDANESLNNTNALAEVEFSAYWAQSYIDTGATYQASRNGGNEWQTLSMSRIGSTDAYRGYLKFATEASNQVITSQTNGSSSWQLNITNNSALGQRFTVSSGAKVLVRSLSVELEKTGTPSGYFYISICSESGNAPGTVLVETSPILVSSITYGMKSYTISDTYLTAGNYYIQIRTDSAYKASYGSSYLVWYGNSASTGARFYNGSTSTWAAPSSPGFNFSVGGISLDLRLKITSSLSTAKLAAFGVFYDKALTASAASGYLNVQDFVFNGSDNVYQFTITRFTPSPYLLRVYDIYTGQAYVYGAFTIQGQTITFDSGQFYQPGQTVKLRFMQTEGSVFDTSDINGLLLAANSLGSTDATIDRSVAGRGIYLRRPDGTLREITIDNNDQIVIYSV